jgi:hypothetical protein
VTVAIRKPVPEPTPEQIERILNRLLGACTTTEQRALFRIGKKAGLFWTHRGCPAKGSVNFLTDDRCVHCAAERPAPKEPRP